MSTFAQKMYITPVSNTNCTLTMRSDELSACFQRLADEYRTMKAETPEDEQNAASLEEELKLASKDAEEGRKYLELFKKKIEESQDKE